MVLLMVWLQLDSTNSNSVIANSPFFELKSFHLYLSFSHLLSVIQTPAIVNCFSFLLRIQSSKV